MAVVSMEIPDEIQAEKIKECINIMLENKIRLSENICNIVMAHVGLED